MPRKDIYHECVKNALIKDGWVITHDPFRLDLEDDLDLYPDLGAEKVIVAERATEKIAVEVKSFRGQILQRDFYEALGQYDNYSIALAEIEPERSVVLAIPLTAYETFFQKQFIKKVIAVKRIQLLVYDVDNQTITSWKR